MDTDSVYGSSADPPPPGSLGEAVHIFFDRMGDALPIYVSKRRATKMSLIICAVIVLMIRPTIMKMKREAEGASDQAKWIGTSLATLFVLSMIQPKITSVVYMMDMFKYNKQHICNLHWIGEYANALRA